MDTPSPPAVATGAPSGFGAARARLFAQDGRPPPFLGRRLEQPRAPTLGGAVDASGRTAVTRASREAEGAYGATGALVNSAGVMLTGDPVTRDPAERYRMSTLPEAGPTADDVADAIRHACRQSRNVYVRKIAPASAADWTERASAGPHRTPKPPPTRSAGVSIPVEPVGRVGLEPTTNGLKVHCSAN